MSQLAERLHDFGAALLDGGRPIPPGLVGPDGAVTHHLPPEYHGDPVDNAGCLCFQVFGWSVLDDLRAAGFAEAHTVFYWSPDCGYLGPNQLQIIATTAK